MFRLSFTADDCHPSSIHNPTSHLDIPFAPFTLHPLNWHTLSSSHSTLLHEWHQQQSIRDDSKFDPLDHHVSYFRIE